MTRITETILGKVATFEMGQAPPGTECNKEKKGTLFVKAGEFGQLYPEQKEWTTKPLKLGKKGDVFICVVGATAGKLNLGIDCAIGRSVAAIRPNDGIDTKFVYYQLQPFVLKLRSASSGSAQGVISKQQLHEIPFRVVNLDEQQRIVAEIEKQFSRLDEAVANLKRVKANLKRYKASVLKAAVEGKLTEEWRKQHPDVEPGSKLLERILAERRARWSGRRGYKEPKGPDTEALPSLPRGWEWATAEQLTDETRAITYGVIKLGPHKPDGIPVLRSSDVRSLYLDMREVKRVAPEIAGQFKRTFLKGNEVLVTVRGTLGGVVVAPQQCAGFNISREVAKDCQGNSNLHRFRSCPALAHATHQGDSLYRHQYRDTERTPFAATINCRTTPNCGRSRASPVGHRRTRSHRRSQPHPRRPPAAGYIA